MVSQVAEQVENLSALARAKPFLGREFLTWLWHEIEVGPDQFSIRTASGENWQVSLWIDDKIVLESALGLGHVHSMKGGDPSRSPEAAASLLTGKSVREMKLGLQVETLGDFTCVLNWEDLAPRGLQLPRPEFDDAEPGIALEQRLQLTNTFLDLLRALFTKFLEERVEKDWDQEGVSKIKSWIKNRASSETQNRLH